jgi:hypothetical protein
MNSFFLKNIGNLYFVLKNIFLFIKKYNNQRWSVPKKLFSQKRTDPEKGRYKEPL